MSYFSVVMTGRNDDHCAGFVRRMQNAIHMYGYFADLYGFKFEIVIVEWNPLNCKPLADTLVNLSAHLTIRIITVPKEIHDQVEH